MKAGLLGGTYAQRSLPYDAQRSINLFPVISETHDSKEVGALYGTPGLKLFATCGAGPIRGGIACANGRLFVLSGNTFYELLSDGTATSKGTVSTYSGNVSMDENGRQIMVATGADGYIFDFLDTAQLVVNGTFDTDTDWTKGAGWTIATGVATATGAISTSLSQTTIAATPGVAYSVTITITRSAGTITPTLNGTAGTARSADGTYTGTIIAGASGGLVFTCAGFTGTLDTVTVQQLTDQFIHITDPDFPGADYVTFQDGFFIVNKPSSGEFYISSLYDGTQWDALDFATAESGPDNLVAVFSAYGNLWLFGVNTTEIWSDTGDGSFPFARSQGGKMETGCAARFSIAKADNSIFWVGQDKYGKGMVYKALGAAPQRISTQAIEYALSKAGDLSTLIGYCYQQEGHLRYVLTGAGLETTLVYDSATQMWHEWAHLNANGEFELHNGVFQWFAFGKNLTGDRATGKVYQIDMNTYTDAGDPIKRVRIFTHINQEGVRFIINSLQVDFETGVGLVSGQGSDPIVILEFSTDGGRTWSQEYQASIGKIGQFNIRAVWRRLGQFEQCTFRVSISDPVKVAIVGAYFNA